MELHVRLHLDLRSRPDRHHSRRAPRGCWRSSTGARTRRASSRSRIASRPRRAWASCARCSRTSTSQRLKGPLAVGHVRYPTVGIGEDTDVQPFWLDYPISVAMAHNGNVTNFHELRRDYFGNRDVHLSEQLRPRGRALRLRRRADAPPVKTTSNSTTCAWRSRKCSIASRAPTRSPASRRRACMRSAIRSASSRSSSARR